jgi:hypothetical protein
LPDGATGEIIVRSDEDDGDVSPIAAKLFLDLKSAHTRQADVDDCTVGTARLRQILFTGLEQMDLVSMRSQRATHRTPNVLVIVNDSQGQLGRVVGHVSSG